MCVFGKERFDGCVFGSGKERFDGCVFGSGKERFDGCVFGSGKERYEMSWLCVLDRARREFWL